MIIICNHSHNVINLDTKVDPSLLSDLIDCEECQIQTPKIRSRPMGMAVALLETICWTVLRPFAALLSLPLRGKFMERHETLSKCARILTFPKNKSNLCFQEFLGYMKWSSQAKAKIIYAQRSKFLLHRLIFAKDWESEPKPLKTLFKRTKTGFTAATKHLGVSFSTNYSMNFKRLPILRSSNFLENAKSFTFDYLFKNGYLSTAVNLSE